MAGDTVRMQVAAWLDRRMNGPETLCRPRAAMVFAPHPDDETLGCGGTVVKLRRAGVDVHIVFMTDGRHSHDAHMAPPQLAAMRAQEAQAAAAELGVSTEQVTCLAWEDGQLTAHQADAQAQVVALLAAHRPAAVFVPFRHDGPADHAATWRVVRGALQTHGHTVDVYEYPVWFWLHWPRAPIPRRGDGFLRHVVITTLQSGCGWRMAGIFRRRIYVGDVLDRKWAALLRHRTQLHRMQNDPSWSTLTDVAGGEWLAHFFREYEPFHWYRFSPPHGG